MSKAIAGQGGRKPQIDIEIKQLRLDPENPRLVQYLEKSKPTEQDLVSILYEYFETETIAISMCKNGYFDEEPIVVAPVKVPKGFDWDREVDVLERDLGELAEKGEVTFSVVEGNRRVATIMLLLDEGLRERVGVDRTYPQLISKQARKDLERIPCIVYRSREHVSPYLGVRHMIGNLKWEAFARAYYTASVIDGGIGKGGSINDAILNVQNTIGDRSDVIRKQYVAYKLYDLAKNDLGIPTKPILDRFSLLTVLYNSAGIRDFVGLNAYSEIDFKKRLVPPNKNEEFKQVISWVYGNAEEGLAPVINDSRKISKELNAIAQHEEAREYLTKYRDLEGAFERTSGERDYLAKTIKRGTRSLETSLKFAYKYKKDKELLQLIDELEAVIQALKENLSK